jgi:hypothetical protein
MADERTQRWAKRFCIATPEPIATRTREKEDDMPRYEVVTHATYELDAATPEEAAALLLRNLGGAGVGTVEIHRLALWREPSDGLASPLPHALRWQLAGFFRGVAESAAKADEVFRTRVTAILATTPPAETAMESPATVDRPPTTRRDLSVWENEGGRVRGRLWRD